MYLPLHTYSFAGSENFTPFIYALYTVYVIFKSNDRFIEIFNFLASGLCGKNSNEFLSLSLSLSLFLSEANKIFITKD